MTPEQIRNGEAANADLRYASLRGAILRGANLRYADLQNANLWGADLQNASLRGADLRGANLQSASRRYARLQNADLRGAWFPAPTMLLQCEWGRCSDKLTLWLMRLDASCHPDPGAFDRWAEEGYCPYSSCHWQRAANFQERMSLWKPGRPPRIMTIVNALLREHTKQGRQKT